MRRTGVVWSSSTTPSAGRVVRPTTTPRTTASEPRASSSTEAGRAVVAEAGARRFAGEEEGYTYARAGNPTVTSFEQRLAALEGTEAAVSTSSGMAALLSETLDQMI